MYTFFVVAGNILMVDCCRSETFLTGVVAAGAARPSVVVWGASGGLDTCSAELLSKVGPGSEISGIDGFGPGMHGWTEGTPV